MLPKIRGIKENSTNSAKEVSLYNIILNIYDDNIKNYLAVIDDEEKIDLKGYLNSKIKELDELIKKANNQEKIENLDKKRRKLLEYLICLKTASLTYINTLEIKKNYCAALLSSIGKKASMLMKYRYDGIILNKEKIEEIINNIDNNSNVQEVINYILYKEKIAKLKDYINKRKLILKVLKELLNNNDTIVEYQRLLTLYFKQKDEYDRLSIAKQDVVKEISTYEKNIFQKIFNRRTIAQYSNYLKELNANIEKITYKPRETKEKIYELIKGIKNKTLYYLFDYNKDIVLTLGYINHIENPFIDETLDLPMNKVLSSPLYSDLLYFLGSNLHNINKDNLLEYVTGLKNAIENDEELVSNMELKLVNMFNQMTNDSKNMINNNYDLAEMITILTTQEDIYGIKLIKYLYALNSIATSDEITHNNIKHYIDFSEELSSGPVLKKKK